MIMSENILDTIDLVLLGERLQNARIAAEVTIEQASRCVNTCTTTHIEMIESGNVRITAYDLIKLAQLYRTQIHFLLKGPLPYTTSNQVIEACIDGEISEGMLAHFLGVDRLETRRRVQEYQRHE